MIKLYTHPILGTQYTINSIPLTRKEKRYIKKNQNKPLKNIIK